MTALVRQALIARVGNDRSRVVVLTMAVVALVTAFMLGPGGYRFGDYWKLGLPLLALFGVVAVLLVPVIWSL